MTEIPNNRKDEWEEFSKNVVSHVLEYTVKQYGEKGEDQVTNWSIEDLIVQIQKYCHRYGNNVREGQEHLDFQKIAHYACMAYWKYIESGKNKGKSTFTITGDYGTILSKLKELDKDTLYKITKITVEAE